MRAIAIPVLAVALTVVGGSDEPVESAMRRAFEARLASEVQSALDYVEEIGGAEALERVKQAGTDLFTVRSFTKLDCRRRPHGHSCAFAVEIATVAGPIQQVLGGRLFSGRGGLVFDHDA
jgi:hypothetical protein